MFASEFAVPIIISSRRKSTRSLFITAVNLSRPHDGGLRSRDAIARSMAAMNFDSSLWNRIDYQDLIHFSFARMEQRKDARRANKSLPSYIFDRKRNLFAIDHRSINNTSTLKLSNIDGNYLHTCAITNSIWINLLNSKSIYLTILIHSAGIMSSNNTQHIAAYIPIMSNRNKNIV